MALHKILLGDQGAASRWLPFAIAQLYACPEGAKVSTSPAPGVEITLTRLRGQDTVQIKAGGDPDFVILDNVNPNTAFTIPQQFIPNNPNLQPEGTTNALSSRLYALGDFRLLSSSGQGLQNDMTNPYIENIDTWGWEGAWFYPINRFQITTAPATSPFTIRDPTPVVDCYYKPTPTSEPVKRIVAIQSEDSHATPINPGQVHYSDDLGATWTTNPYPAAPVANGAWFAHRLERVDIDKLMYSVYLFNRASGLPTQKLYFLVGGSGATAWGQASVFQPATPSLISSASFHPGNAEGIVNGLANVIRVPATPGSRFLRTIRSTDSCTTFTYADVTSPSTHIDQSTGPFILRIHTDPQDKDTYAAVWILRPPFNQGGGIVNTYIHLAYTTDNGLSWQLSPEFEVQAEASESSFILDSHGFYNGSFYFYAGAKGSGLKRLYFTDDLGLTWSYTTHSEFTGRGLSSSVQCFKNRLAYPHRSDML